MYLQKQCCFIRWLEQQRKKLAHAGEYYEDYQFGGFVAATIATEASRIAADLHLPELMRVWEERAEVPEVDQYLVECLAGIPNDTMEDAANPFLDYLREVKQNVRVYDYAFEPNSKVKDTLTVPEVALELKTSENTIRGWINSGELQASNLATQGKRYVILREELNRFLKSRQPEPPQKKKRKKDNGDEFRRYRD